MVFVSPPNCPETSSAAYSSWRYFICAHCTTNRLRIPATTSECNSSWCGTNRATTFRFLYNVPTWTTQLHVLCPYWVFLPWYHAVLSLQPIYPWSLNLWPLGILPWSLRLACPPNLTQCHVHGWWDQAFLHFCQIYMGLSDLKTHPLLFPNLLISRKHSSVNPSRTWFPWSILPMNWVLQCWTWSNIPGLIVLG